METSAATATNVDSAFLLMIEGNFKCLYIEIYNKFHIQMEENDEDLEIVAGQKLQSTKEEKKKGCC